MRPRRTLRRSRPRRSQTRPCRQPHRHSHLPEDGGVKIARVIDDAVVLPSILDEHVQQDPWLSGLTVRMSCRDWYPAGGEAGT